MSKRKRDDEHKIIKKARHQYEPKIDTHICELGNELLKFTPIFVTILDDFHWPGISHTNGRSIYRLETFYIHDNGKLMVLAEIIKSSITNRGKYCEFEAESLKIQDTEWDLPDKKSIPKITVDELGHIHKRDHAQKRSDEWARQVKIHRKSDEYVLILDGTGRNLNALLKTGVPAKYIIIVEREPLTALYHKLLSIRLQEEFETHWIQEIRRHASYGVEGLINVDKLPHQNEISCAYFDFDSDIPKHLNRYLESGKLKKLRLCGITQAKRNHKNEMPIIGKTLQDFDHPKVWCRFMMTDPSEESLPLFKKISHNTFEILD
jgi:hypothetical protein